MKKHWKLILFFAVILAIAWSWKGSPGKDPDEKLIVHYDRICKIAEKGIKSPHSGLKKFFSYYGRNGPDMLKQFGALLVHVERIKDDEAHDRRAALAGRRMNGALDSCSETYLRFAMAIADDPKALALAERGADRMMRSLELIFGDVDEDMLPGLGMMKSMRGSSFRDLRE